MKYLINLQEKDDEILLDNNFANYEPGSSYFGKLFEDSDKMDVSFSLNAIYNINESAFKDCVHTVNKSYWLLSFSFVPFYVMGDTSLPGCTQEGVSKSYVQMRKNQK